MTKSKSKSERKHSHLNSFLAGTVSGGFQSVALVWYDKALFLSVVHKRKFLCATNFEKPFSGLFQSLGHRILSGTLYFPLEDYFMKAIPSSLPFYHFWVGSLAGMVNGMVLNPISAIRYQYWNKNISYSTTTKNMKSSFQSSQQSTTTNGGGSSSSKRYQSFLSTGHQMFKQGGFSSIFRGNLVTMVRDVIFGSIFTISRFYFRDMSEISSSSRPKNSKEDRKGGMRRAVMLVFVDFLSGSAATILSSPFNYVRNILYSLPSSYENMNNNKKKTSGGKLGGKGDCIKEMKNKYSTINILIRLYQDALNSKSLFQHLQSRLRIGWGTLR